MVQYTNMHICFFFWISSLLYLLIFLCIVRYVHFFILSPLTSILFVCAYIILHFLCDCNI